MSIDSRTEVVPASGQIRLANANFAFIISASGAFTLTLSQRGSTETFTGLAAGLQISRLNKWDFAFLTAAPGVTITYLYGITFVREDNTLLQQQIATISGGVTVQTIPAVTVTDAVNVACPNAAQTAVVPVNLLRRRFAISFASNAAIGAATVYVRKTGGANNLIEVQAGVLYNFEGTYGVDVRNDSGGALSALVFEES